MKSLYESLLDDEDEVVDKLEMKPLIEEWLKKYGIKTYKINSDNTIDVKGDVFLHYYLESKLPSYIQFKKVTGSFCINNSKLETLRGVPKKVGGNLISLKGIPKEVGGNFWCKGCKKLNITRKDIEKNCSVIGNIIL